MPLLHKSVYSYSSLLVSAKKISCEGIECQLSAVVLVAIFSGAAGLLVLVCLVAGCVMRQRLRRKSEHSLNAL